MQLLMINVDNIGKGRLHDSFSLLWCTQHLFFFPLTSIIFFIPYKKCLLSIWSLNINNLISICKIIFNIVYISVISSKLDWNKVLHVKFQLKMFLQIGTKIIILIIFNCLLYNDVGGKKVRYCRFKNSLQWHLIMTSLLAFVIIN